MLCAFAGCGRPPKPGSRDVPEDVRAVPGVYVDVNPRWSHDGKRIAFLRATTDRRLQLHVSDEDLQRPRALFVPELVSPDRGYSPQLQRYNGPDTLAWSPDDHQIAFARTDWFKFEDGERLPGMGLWTFDTYTRAVKPLALHPAKYSSLFYYFHTPAWSPDGRYLAFVGEGINGQRVLFLHPLRAQFPREVTPRFDNYEDSDWPAWKPAEETERQGDQSETAQNSTPNPRYPTLAFRQGIVNALAAPPVDTLRMLSPGNTDIQTGREVWRIKARGLRPLLPPSSPDTAVAPRVGHLVWSPDGRRLAFTLTPDANDYARYELWTMRADGTQARRVSPQDGRGYVAPVWIGNERLGALSPYGQVFQVIRIGLETGEKRVLGTIPTSDCDWSPDRRRVVYATPPSNQPQASVAPTTLRLLHVGTSRTMETAATLPVRSGHVRKSYQKIRKKP